MSKTKTQHTAGPWSAVQADAQGRYYVRIQGAPVGTLAICQVMNRGERYANARLIAAAPDMLAALLEARSWIAQTSNGRADGLYNDVCAAVAKAQ